MTIDETTGLAHELLADLAKRIAAEEAIVRQRIGDLKWLAQEALQVVYPCPGCDGHECDDSCQYPAAGQTTRNS